MYHALLHKAAGRDDRGTHLKLFQECSFNVQQQSGGGVLE